MKFFRSTVETVPLSGLFSRKGDCNLSAIAGKLRRESNYGKIQRGRKRVTFIDQLIDDNEIRENQLGRAMETMVGKVWLEVWIWRRSVTLTHTHKQINTGSSQKSSTSKNFQKFIQISKHFHLWTLTFLTNSLD